MFASQAAGINPDFMCLSKGITAGYLPMGATLTTDKIYKAFYAPYRMKKTFFHGHTYTANPLSCAAALASLEVFKQENTLKQVENIIPYFHSRMETFRNLEYVGDVRYLGLVGAIELVKNKPTKQGFSFKERIGLKVYRQGLKHNLILRPLGNVIYLFLPLCIKKPELDDIIDKMYELLSKT